MRGSFLWPKYKDGLELTLHLNFQLTICDNDEEIVDDMTAIEHRLLVKSMHKKVSKGTNSGCLDNQYR